MAKNTVATTTTNLSTTVLTEQKYMGLVSRVRKVGQAVSKGYAQIAGDVARLYETDNWKESYTDFSAFCSDMFGFSHGTTSNLRRVGLKFYNLEGSDRKLRPCYDGVAFGVLAEFCKLSPDEIGELEALHLDDKEYFASLTRGAARLIVENIMDKRITDKQESPAETPAEPPAETPAETQAVEIEELNEGSAPMISLIDMSREVHSLIIAFAAEIKLQSESGQLLPSSDTVEKLLMIQSAISRELQSWKL